ncbi:MAG: chemotaxis protein CheX [Betaproteobacteria bacterium]|nr:chemotaxis protein CheX [Betaproteobacteria bacterium]
MTLMKDAPLPTFGKSIRSVLVGSIKEAMQLYGIDVQEEPQVVCKNMMICGDYLAGIRISGDSFQGAVTLAMDRNITKGIAEKIFAGTQAKSDDSMLCDIVGEVCNQITGVIQRKMGVLGCRIQVSAQMTAQTAQAFDSGAEPNEWLMTPFLLSSGRGVLSFGFEGSLSLSDEEAPEDLSDARNITFF